MLRLHNSCLQIAPARIHDLSGTGQIKHGQATADTGEQAVNRLELGVIPLVDDKGIDAVAGLLQCVARLLHYLTLDQGHILGRSQALHIILCRAFTATQTGNPLQTGFHKQDATGHIHQGRIGQFTVTSRHQLQLLNLLQQHTPGLPQTQHGQGIGHLFHAGQQPAQVLRTAAIATHKEIKLILDMQQLFSQCLGNRLHGRPVRTNQLPLALG